MSELAQKLVDALGIGSVGDSGEVELDDDKAVRLSLEPDYDTSVSDFPDCYGRFEPVRRFHGESQRPSDFDGNAEKLWIDNDQVWWQPPEDVKRTDPTFDEFRRTVKESAEFGFMVVVVERLEGTDHYGKGIVRGGVEANAKREYLVSIVDDMLAQVGVSV